MSKFKLDKSNQKQLWNILNELSAHEDLDDYDRAMLYEAAEVIQSFDAPERDTKEYWNITKWTWKKNEPSYDPDIDAIRCAFCRDVIPHGETPYHLGQYPLCKHCVPQKGEIEINIDESDIGADDMTIGDCHE